ncbi:MAG: ATP-binding protein [Roseiarcus sp.]
MLRVDDDRQEREREIAKLKKINAALMSRVERSFDKEFNAYSLFETAIALDNQVRRRTHEVQQALRSIERANDELLRAKQQAEAASSLKSAVLTSISHDLLQPLNAARLALSALAEIDLEREPKGLVAQADRGLATLEELIRTLLDLSRLDAGVATPDLRDFALDGVLQSLAGEQARVAAKRGLKLRVARSRVVVRSDPLLLRRIVQNLLANALRYTRRGGVLLGGRARGGRWIVEVWDTGPGIAEERREAIFQEFQRGEAGSAGGEGFGLGLAIVRRLAHALDHPVGLSSRVGKGSIFSVSLPLGDAAAALATPAAERAAPEFGAGVGGAKVLLIDNDPAALAAMEALLTRWGCDIAAAQSGAEALERVRALGGAPDAIVADLHLDHGERGAEAVAAIRRHVQRLVPAIIVTADHSAAAAEEAASGGLEVLRKPVRPAELRSLLSFLLR